ncbi:MAG: hypothetical protein IT359_05300 [Gemmatimonadaceae bacterium]|nr:hypothetical protein [Gemmatimonadaceae bacterium]
MSSPTSSAGLNGTPTPREVHPLAESLAAAFLGEAEPEPVDFVMLLTEMTQLSPQDYVSLWSDVVTIGTGVPTTPRERADYSYSARSQLVEATRLAARMGEISEKLQLLVMRALRLQLRAQRRRRIARAGLGGVAGGEDAAVEGVGVVA